MVQEVSSTQVSSGGHRFEIESSADHGTGFPERVAVKRRCRPACFRAGCGKAELEFGVLMLHSCAESDKVKHHASLSFSGALRQSRPPYVPGYIGQITPLSRFCQYSVGPSVKTGIRT